MGSFVNSLKSTQATLLIGNYPNLSVSERIAVLLVYFYESFIVFHNEA